MLTHRLPSSQLLAYIIAPLAPPLLLPCIQEWSITNNWYIQLDQITALPENANNELSEMNQFDMIT